MNILVCFILLCHLCAIFSDEGVSERIDSELNSLSLYDMIDSRLFQAHNISPEDLNSLDPSSDLFVYCQYAKKTSDSKLETQLFKIFFLLIIFF